MTQLITTEFSEPGARFAPDVFDSQIGKEIPFKVEGREAGVCSLLGYSVSEDGSFATMTFEVPDVFHTLDELRSGLTVEGEQ